MEYLELLDITEKEINESLDSVVEFYATEDSALPNDLYMALKIDASTYIVSIRKFNAKGLYMCEVGLYTGSKITKKWHFASSSHVRKVLATLPKIIESSLPFIPSMSGLAMKISSKATKNYVPFVKKIFMKSHIKNKFDFLEIDNTKNKGKDQFFMMGIKSKSYHQIFGAKLFSQYFKDNPDLPEIKTKKDAASNKIPGEVLGKITSKKIEKKQKSVVPSSKIKLKYEFPSNKETVELGIIDTEHNNIEDIVNNAKQVDLLKAKSKTEKEKSKKPEPEPIKLKKIKSSANSKTYTPDELVELMAFMFYQRLVKIHQGGDKPEKKYFNSEAMKKLLGDKNLINLELKATPKQVSNWKNALLERVFTLSDDAIYNYFNAAFTIVANIEDTKPKKKSTPNKKVKVIKHNKLDTDIESKFDFQNEFGKTHAELLKTGLNISANKVDSLYVNESTTKVKDNLKITNLNKIISYTGSSYDSYNGILRNPHQYDKKNLAHYTKINKLMAKGFHQMGPSDRDIIVFRNANIDNGVIWDLGKDIIDPAWMSTSLNSSIGINNHGNTRLVIYVPKGSMIMPILNNSHHTGEREIILPAMSILKPVEIFVQESYGNTKQYIKCVYSGNGMDSYIEYVENKLLKEERILSYLQYMTEEKKTEDKEETLTNNKWYNFANAKDIKEAEKLIKSGKVKVADKK